jgi:4'-phosphopantetheinyl transferase
MGSYALSNFFGLADSVALSRTGIRSSACLPCHDLNIADNGLRTTSLSYTDTGVPDDIHVLQVDFDFEMQLHDTLFDVMSDDERHRASRFVRYPDAIRFAVCRSVLRNCLSAAIGQSAHLIRFVSSASGRPSLYADRTIATIDFNVSHSEDLALIAWSGTRRVGVDIESHRGALNWESQIPSVFGTADMLQFTAATPAQRRGLFFDIWVAKEALLKADGVGIGARLSEFSVASDNPRSPMVQGFTELGIKLRQFDASWLRNIDGYAACLAWSSSQK